MRLRMKGMAAVLAVLAAGCGGGGSSNNDQGTSFSLIGFNSTDDNNVCQQGEFISGVRVPLSGGTGSETTGDAGYFTCLTIQNNMSTQFVRADRVLLDYHVDGASEQPPSTTSAFSRTVGPATAAADTNAPTSSLPPGYAEPSEATAGFNVLPPQISQWIGLNRSKLPEAPFQLVATVRVAAVTSSGDRLESNPADLLLAIVPDNTIRPTTEGSAGGTGATGGLTDDSGGVTE